MLDRRRFKTKLSNTCKTTLKLKEAYYRASHTRKYLFFQPDQTKNSVAKLFINLRYLPLSNSIRSDAIRQVN